MKNVTMYTYKAASGTDSEKVLGTSFAVHVGMCGWVLQNERSLLFGESRPCWLDEKTAWEEGQQSAVLVPLFGRKKIIGGLSALGKKGGGSFSQHDLDLLTMFANQVSTAIENAMLFQQVEVEIQERRQAEKNLRQITHQQELILNSAGEGIYGLDMDGRVTFINPAAAKMLGWEVQELVGKNSHLTWHYLKSDGTPYPVEECVLHKLLKSGTANTVNNEVFQKKSMASFPVEYTSTPIIENDKLVGAVVTFKNITEYKRAEIEKKKMEEQLRQAQKMEAIGALAGGVAHDFNNILTAIIGYASLMESQMKPDDPLRHNIVQVLNAAELATVLTHSLLAFSRKQDVDLKPVKLNEIICGFQKILTRLIGEDIEFKVNCTSEDLTVEADTGQIEQVLMNLVTNARDAMRGGGTLQITTSSLELDSNAIPFHNITKPGKYAFISVSDSGAGMDKDIKEHIFEPFFTTKEAGKGTGLGLAIVYGIIEKHNGSVHVYSEPGQGTTFNIYLPLVTAMPQNIRKKTPVMLPPGHETILLAEDEETVRQVLKFTLEEYGYTVMEATNGTEAVEVFLANQDKIQLLLCDLIMPKKNGREAYEEIKKIRPDIKAIFMSGYTKDLIVKKGIMEEGVNFISKPLTPTELLNKIRMVLESK